LYLSRRLPGYNHIPATVAKPSQPFFSRKDLRKPTLGAAAPVTAFSAAPPEPVVEVEAEGTASAPADV